MFRLFKTLNEAKKISDLLSKELTTESILNIGVRASFGIYWIFDNLNILSKIKLLNFDPKQMGKTGATFWLVALLLNLVLLIKTLLDNIKKVNETKKYSSMTDSEVKERRKELGTLLIKRGAILLNIVKVVGDVIPAGHGS